MVTVIRTQSQRIGRHSASWVGARTGGSGDSISPAGIMYLLTQNFLGAYDIWRNFITYNTGGTIPSNAVISQATFYIYIYVKNFYHDNTTQGVLTQSTQANPNSPTIQDYSRITLNDPEEAGARFNLNDVSVYRNVIFSKDRLSWIKRAGEVSNNGGDEGYTLLCIRANKDVDNETPVFLGCNIGFLNVFVPPYLIVTYTTATLFGATIEAGTIEG